ncbi:MAG: F0F1 ATP synthase subunit B' [Bosea sp.]|jgi:F-type H+-transporting ATPase subunit b|nr:F0F1 ATP synthase subunit B' [Bosea sp. (in: a-proteobacteria)]
MATPQTAGTQVPGGAPAGPGFPPFKTETFASQLLWLAIFFGLLYWLVSKVFAPRLSEVIEGRASRIARDLDEAAAARTRAQEAGVAYEKALAEARNRAQAIAQDKRAEVNAAVEARRAALEHDLSAKLGAAEAQITASKDKAMASVAGIAAEAAAAIVQRLGGSAPSSGEVDAALKSVMKA